MKVDIEPTREDIEDCVRGSCKRCAVASAINRVLRPGFHAGVAPSEVPGTTGGFGIYKHTDSLVDRRYYICVFKANLPSKLNEFANAFDTRKSDALAMLPLKEEIDIPEKYLKPEVGAVNREAEHGSVSDQ